jgi:RNA polymerase sigma-70 factor (ECF subfamily)
LLGLKARDPRAWQRLAFLYAPLVYRWCRQRGLQAADADDVVQEVFRTVLARIGDFRRDRPQDTFRGWLWMITRNKLGDHFRRAARVGLTAAETLEQLPAEEPTIEPDVGESLYRRALDLIRPQFEETTWRAFWRVVVEDGSPANVAAELGITPNAVYLAKARVLRRLREELGDRE